MQLRAVIYTRVSSDKTGRAKSVTEQEAECRAECERRGWPVAEVLTDNDLSATRYARKTRPAYERLKKILAPGDVLVTWESSRAQRGLDAYVELRDLCAERGVFWSYSGKLYDLTDGGDRFSTAIDSAVAEREADDIRKRILRAQRASRAAGKPAGRLLYGYKVIRDDAGRAIRREPDPAEAAVVTECARRALAGDSIGSIAADLNRREVPRRSGAAWTTNTVKKMLITPAYAGLRTHLGEVLPVAGTWEPLLSVDEHNDLIALFATRKSGPRGTAPKHLLSGIATCTKCKGKLWRHRGGTNADGSYTEVYVCRGSHAARKMADLDAAVHAVVETILTTPEALSALAETPEVDPSVPARLTELREQLAAVETEIAEGRMPPATGARVATRLEALIAAAEEEAAPVFTDPAVKALATAPDPVATWRSLPVAGQREFLRAAMVITVAPAGRGRWHDKLKGVTIKPRRLAVVPNDA